jgi:hypothetical protein
MKILALERQLAGVTPDRFTPEILRAEAARLWAIYQSGVARELYFRADEHAAVLVLESGSIEEARRTLGELPLVREGLIEFEMIPLSPYPGFERLFRADATM